MRKSYTKKGKHLQAYSALAASLFAMGNTADAQIIYTNITDYTGLASNNDLYNIDLNNAGGADFRVKANAVVITTSYFSYTTSNNFIRLSPLGGQNAAANNGGMTSAVPANTPINAGLNWVNNGSQLMAYLGGYYSGGGHWLGATDMYLALKLVVGTNTYYGWARLDVASDASSFTIKDYAYESTPGKMILAGDKTVTTSVSEAAPADFAVIPEQGSLKLQFATPGNRQVKLLNVVGQELYTGQVNGAEATIATNGCTSGVYFVMVTDETSSFAKKVYLH